MSTGFVVRASRLATPSQLLADAFVVVQGASVLQVGTGPPPPAYPVVELGDVLMAPGFVDVHVHGGGGYEVNCATADDVARSVREMARFHARHGTTSLLATTVSDSHQALRAALEGVAMVAREPGTGVLGSNLEGPWIAPSRAGAQFPGALRPPSVRQFSELVRCARGTLRLVTLAPELDGAPELIAAAVGAGVVVSVGHTDADYQTAATAFDAGPATPLTCSTPWPPSITVGPDRWRRPWPTTASGWRLSPTACTSTPRSYRWWRRWPPDGWCWSRTPSAPPGRHPAGTGWAPRGHGDRR